MVSTPRDLPPFQELLGDGAGWGLSFSYARQPRPEGIAWASVIGRDVVGADPCCPTLGDNVLHGLTVALRRASGQNAGATVFGCYVRHPGRYGVVSLDADGRAESIEQRQGLKVACPGEIAYRSGWITDGGLEAPAAPPTRPAPACVAAST